MGLSLQNVNLLTVNSILLACEKPISDKCEELNLFTPQDRISMNILSQFSCLRNFSYSIY